jgi:hypothetical protein
LAIALGAPGFIFGPDFGRNYKLLAIDQAQSPPASTVGQPADYNRLSASVLAYGNKFERQKIIRSWNFRILFAAFA